MDTWTRRLVVVRHAKSAWPVGVPDSARPLGPRGERDAPRMGHRIRELVGPIDVVVISPTRRTEQTWELMGPALGHTGPVRTDARIYEGWGSHMIDLVRELPDEVGTAMLLGHEPGVSELVLSLAGTGDDRDRVARKFPTCAVAVLSTSSRWSRVEQGCAALELFTTPKG